MSDRAWPAGAATGIGSLPELEVDEAVRLILGEAPLLPYLPELPGRGVGADMIGRTTAVLVDLPVELRFSRWTLTSSSGRDARRAKDFLRRDLDTLSEHAQGVPVVKVQVCGPMTLGSRLEMSNMHKVLTDPGAFRDLAGSLAEGVRLHVADVQRRLPGTRVVLQVDEPSLPAVLGGQIPTPSGYGTVRSLNPAIAEPALAAVLAGAAEGHRVVHCCGTDIPFSMLATAGASAVSIDADLIVEANFDDIARLLDTGVSLWLGIVPGTDAEIAVAPLRERVLRLGRQLGFGRESIAGSVVPTPACGMAGASLPYVRETMSVLGELGRSLQD